MKIKLYYFWTHPSWMSKGKIEVETLDWRVGSGGGMKDKIFLKEEEVEIPDCAEPSRNEISTELVKNLNKEKSEILADTHQRVAAIDDKINQLLCLEES